MIALYSLQLIRQITDTSIDSTLDMFKVLGKSSKGGEMSRYLNQHIRKGYLSHRKPAKAHASLRIGAFSPESLLFAFAKATHIVFSNTTCELEIVLTRTANILTTKELVKLTMLWTARPRMVRSHCVQLFRVYMVHLLVVLMKRCNDMVNRRKNVNKVSLMEA